jgi:hypothetical protein
MNPTVRSLILSTLLITFVIALGGGTLYALGAGRWELGESMYMSVISVSTVGFGELPGIDRVRGARGVVAAIVLLGLGAVAYFQSAMTAVRVSSARRGGGSA